MNHQELSPELERLAQRRAKAKQGFYGHCLVYLLVIAGLGLLSYSQGKTWAVWPASGWGIGLLMHGLRVFGVGPGSAMRERLVERERAQLRRQA